MTLTIKPNTDTPLSSTQAAPAKSGCLQQERPALGASVYRRPNLAFAPKGVGYFNMPPSALSRPARGDLTGKFGIQSKQKPSPTEIPLQQRQVPVIPAADGKDNPQIAASRPDSFRSAAGDIVDTASVSSAATAMSWNNPARTDSFRSASSEIVDSAAMSSANSLRSEATSSSWHSAESHKWRPSKIWEVVTSRLQMAATRIKAFPQDVRGAITRLQNQYPAFFSKLKAAGAFITNFPSSARNAFSRPKNPPSNNVSGKGDNPSLSHPAAAPSDPVENATAFKADRVSAYVASQASLVRQGTPQEPRGKRLTPTQRSTQKNAFARVPPETSSTGPTPGTNSVGQFPESSQSNANSSSNSAPRRSAGAQSAVPPALAQVLATTIKKSGQARPQPPTPTEIKLPPPTFTAVGAEQSYQVRILSTAPSFASTMRLDPDDSTVPRTESEHDEQRPPPDGCNARIDSVWLAKLGSCDYKQLPSELLMKVDSYDAINLIGSVAILAKKMQKEAGKDDGNQESTALSLDDQKTLRALTYAMLKADSDLEYQDQSKGKTGSTLEDLKEAHSAREKKLKEAFLKPGGSASPDHSDRLIVLLNTAPDQDLKHFKIT